MQLATPLPQPVTRVLRQTLHVRPRRTDPEREGLPPLLEGLVLDLDGEQPLFGVGQAGLAQEPLEIGRASCRERVLYTV